jgi:hypothetical protein
MYNRIFTLRIDILRFCKKFLTTPLLQSKVFEQFREAAKAPRTAHRFGLPFSPQEFLAILDEARKQLHDFQEGIVGSQYAGSIRLFRLMVNDLANYSINMKDFLADHIPEHMEHTPLLTNLLSSLEEERFQINYYRFMETVTKPKPGHVIGPMSHFQAAMFTQSLEEVEQALDPKWIAEVFSGPHKFGPAPQCENDVVADDIAYIGSPCCNIQWPKCCFLQILTQQGPKCL